MAIHDHILQTIGRTPVVRLNQLAPPHVEVFVKLEAFNPMGSVKDRMAHAMIEDAEARGELRPGQTVIEATSGNTGIALAMVCAQRGYPLVIVMAENFSVERRRLMRFLGARVVLTPAAEKGSGMVAKAEELARRHGWFLCRQFENGANARAHRETTAPEILADFADRRLDWWVSGAGTGGTFAGVAEVLRARRPGVRIALCEPDNAPVLASGIAQPDMAADGRVPSHPMFRPHLMQGWSPDFIPAITAGALAAGLADRILPIDGNVALDTARALARREGILAGISAGATLAGTLALAREAEPGTTFLCMLPDTGERYLSTALFADVAADMNEEEQAISDSSPMCRFTGAATSAPAPAPAPAPVAAVEQRAPVSTAPRAAASSAVPSPVDPEMSALVHAMLADRGKPVLMFALAWCEFCWSVRRLFERLRVPLEVVELDAVAWQAADRGGRIRAVLRELTGVPTIPQVFVGGEHLGGCMDVFAALRSGDLQQRLAGLGLAVQPGEAIDPATLLPGWLQERRA
jgi:cysteine synthase A